MRAIILAAGFGTRLQPLTNKTPKPLLEVSGHPLIEWNLRLLHKYGITKVIINTHHLGDQIETYLGNGTALGMDITYSREKTILGTGGGIKQAENFLKQSCNNSFIVLNADTLLDINIKHLLNYHMAHNGSATMVVRNDPNLSQWGTLELNPNGKILTILGQGKLPRDRTHPITQKMFAGLHIMHSSMLENILPGKESSIIDTYIQHLKNGISIYGYETTGYWSDVGTPKRYEETRQDAKTGKLKWIIW